MSLIHSFGLVPLGSYLRDYLYYCRNIFIFFITACSNEFKWLTSISTFTCVYMHIVKTHHNCLKTCLVQLFRWILQYHHVNFLFLPLSLYDYLWSFRAFSRPDKNLRSIIVQWKIQATSVQVKFNIFKFLININIPGFWSWSRVWFRMFRSSWWTTRSWPALRFCTSRTPSWRFWLGAWFLPKEAVLQMVLVAQMPTFLS